MELLRIFFVFVIFEHQTGDHGNDDKYIHDIVRVRFEQRFNDRGNNETNPVDQPRLLYEPHRGSRLDTSYRDYPFLV